MPTITANDLMQHYCEQGKKDGHYVVFGNSIGTNLSIWSKIIDKLPKDLCLIRYDMRGHGLTASTPDPYSMNDLVDDAAALLDKLNVRNCLFVGLSIGGLVAQGLMIKRPDLVAAAVLSNTGAKIGEQSLWNLRIKEARAGRLAKMAPAIIERWFSNSYRKSCPDKMAIFLEMFSNTSKEGYAGCCQAIMETDYTKQIRSIDKPVWAIAGAEDKATPASLVRATADLIPGCGYFEIKGAAHLAPIEKPSEYTAILNEIVNSVFMPAN